MSSFLKKILPLILALAFPFVISGCNPEKKQDASTPQKEQNSAPAQLSSYGMASLSAGDLAFSLGEHKVTWGELLDYLNKGNLLGKGNAGNPDVDAPQEKTNGLTPDQQRAAKNALKHLLRRLVLLDQAKKNSPAITEEDKASFRERWAKENPNANFDDFLKKFPQTKSSQLEMTRDETFMLLKYMSRQLDEVVVPEAELKQTLANFHNIRKKFEAQMASEIEAFKKYPQMEGFNTDEGFMELAREYSDGVEADKGGLIDIPLTRKEIAECNDGQPFDTAVGETSPMIETKTSLRYIRILEEIKPEQAGGEEKYKIAQILYSKKALDIPDSEDVVIKQLKYKHQEEHTAKLIAKLLDGMTFATPIFPDLPQEWPVPKTK